MKRPDTPAILGLIGLAGLLVVGWVVIEALNKNVPPELWIALSTVVGVIGGWVGKTAITDKQTPVAVDDFVPPIVDGENIALDSAPTAQETTVPESLEVVGGLEDFNPPVNNKQKRKEISDHLNQAGQ